MRAWVVELRSAGEVRAQFVERLRVVPLVEQEIRHHAALEVPAPASGATTAVRVGFSYAPSGTEPCPAEIVVEPLADAAAARVETFGAPLPVGWCVGAVSTLREPDVLAGDRSTIVGCWHWASAPSEGAGPDSAPRTWTLEISFRPAPRR